jgi:hypothetical protein
MSENNWFFRKILSTTKPASEFFIDAVQEETGKLATVAGSS